MLAGGLGQRTAAAVWKPEVQGGQKARSCQVVLGGSHKGQVWRQVRQPQILACSLQDREYAYLSHVIVGLYPQALGFLPPNPSMSWIRCHRLFSTLGDIVTNFPLLYAPASS